MYLNRSFGRTHLQLTARRRSRATLDASSARQPEYVSLARIWENFVWSAPIGPRPMAPVSSRILTMSTRRKRLYLGPFSDVYFSPFTSNFPYNIKVSFDRPQGSFYPVPTIDTMPDTTKYENGGPDAVPKSFFVITPRSGDFTVRCPCLGDHEGKHGGGKSDLTGVLTAGECKWLDMWAPCCRGVPPPRLRPSRPSSSWQKVGWRPPL